MSQIGFPEYNISFPPTECVVGGCIQASKAGLEVMPVSHQDRACVSAPSRSGSSPHVPPSPLAIWLQHLSQLVLCARPAPSRRPKSHCVQMPGIGRHASIIIMSDTFSPGRRWGGGYKSKIGNQGRMKVVCRLTLMHCIAGLDCVPRPQAGPHSPVQPSQPKPQPCFVP